MSLAGYLYHKKGAVNATTAGAQTLYQLKLIVGESSGASGADVHCENHCLDFPNDVRFTKEDGETKHDYWVEGITGTTPNRKATVWIEVTSIPASGSVDFYMYYRKTSDSGESDGNNTFVAFDDFEVTPTLNPWTRYSGNPVLPKNPSSPSADYYFVNNGKILKNVSENPKTPYKDGSDRYYMYYCGSGNIDGLNNDQTFLARSTDLITWTRVGVVIPFGNGTFQDGAWDDADTQMGTVLYDSDSSTFMMWYNGNNNPSSDYCRLGYATSANGINWTKYAGNPILSQGPDGDADDLYAPIVIKDGSTWKMWYAGQKAGGGRIALMYATASNPEGPWTKYSTAHIYDPGYNFFPAEVWKESGTYHMIFFPLTVTDLRHATSPDGITWTYDAIIFERGESAEWDDHHIQEVSQILIGSTWYSFYTGGGAAGVFSIGYATSSARIPTPATDPLDDWGGQTASYGALDDRAFDGDYSLKKTGANGEANAYIYLTETTADIEIWLRVWNGDALDKRGGVFIGTSGDADHYYCAYLSVWDSGNTIRFLEFNNGGYVSDKGFQNIGAISPNQWCKVVLRRVGTTWTAYAYLEDGTLLGSKEITLSITSGFVGIHFYDTATYMDQFLARKYASPEPTWGSWGAEIGGSTPLAGVIAATSTLSGALNVQKPLSGAIAASTLVTGALGISRPFAGAIAASTLVTGALAKYRALAGDTNATSRVGEGNLLLENGDGILLETGDDILWEGGIDINVEWSLSGQITAGSRIGAAGGEALLENGADLLLETGYNLLWESGVNLCVEWTLLGEIAANSPVVGSLGISRPFAGVVAASTTVSGILTQYRGLGGEIDSVSAVAGTLPIIRQLAGDINPAGNLLLEIGDELLTETGDNLSFSTYQTEVTGKLSFVAATRGFYYAKLGTDNLHNPPETSFRITTELNNIASFDYTVQNDAHNRTIIANNLTDDFSMMRDDGTELLRGSIDSDSIEYYTQGEGRGRGRIRLSGFANFVDLKYLIYKRMADGDAEDVGSVQDQDYTPSDFTNFTTQANNAAVNDVQLTFGGVNDALYIGKNETFFAAKIKYTTKGIQAANTTVVMEYSKGSGVWATLDCIDESYSFTEDAGTYLLYIPNKADDWAKDTVNGKKQYYIRFRLTEGSYSTSPKLDQIKLSNADVCRVQFNDTAADTILGYLLEGTGYTEDATDQCPSTEITIRGEYDSRLRWIYGLGSALTWEDSNGDIQRYDCWIDTSKKVHYKQHRGTDQGDISADFRALSNKIGYGEMGTRIFSTGGQEGINQKKAVVEDLTAQGLHKLREIVLEDNRITAYEGIKEEALKSLANRKNPLKDVTGDLDTKYYLDTTMDVGDKILVHQPDWNLNNQELYIMRAVIGPSETKLDLGNSQIHLEHLRSTLQRQMDIGNVWMHGSVSTYVVGPEEDNYERKDATTAYPLRFTIEVPDNARGINHVEIGWELLPYKSSVGGSGSGGGHSHSSGPSGRDGAHLHNTAASYGGGGHGHSTGGSGLHNHGVSNAGDHWHDVTVTLSYYTAQAVTIVYDTAYAGAHSHSNPNTSGPSSTSSVLYGLNYGSQCTSGYCITGGPTTSVASSGHSHSQGGTGSGGNHYHTTTSGKAYFVTSITQPGGFTTSQHDGHVHPVGYEPAHGHSVTTVDNHAHSIPDTNTEDDHEHTIPESSTEPAHYHVVDYGVYEIPGGTTLELYVGDELVGDTYVGDQSGINITGWITKGHNSITLKPIVGDNVKGRAKMSATCTVFLENLK